MGDAQGLSGADILKADDIKIVAVDAPAWGKRPVYVRTLTGVERMRWSKIVGELSDEGSELLAVCAVVFTLCDKEGAPLFKGTLKEVHALAAKSGSAIFKVFAAADEINGFTEKTVEQLAGN